MKNPFKRNEKSASKPVHMQSDQCITTRALDNGAIETSTNGYMKVNFEVIESIGIAGLTDIVKHEITRAFGSVSHYMRFKNGGEVRLSIAESGAVLQFETLGVEVTVQGGKQLTLAVDQQWRTRS